MASRSNGDGPRSYQCSASPTTGWLSSKLAVPQSQVAGFGFEMHVAWAAAADCEPFVFKTDGVVARDRRGTTTPKKVNPTIAVVAEVPTSA